MKKILIGLLILGTFSAFAASIKIQASGFGSSYLSASERFSGIPCNSFFTGIKKSAKMEAVEDAIDNVISKCEEKGGAIDGRISTRKKGCSCRGGWYGDSFRCYAIAKMRCRR